jgi:hypothetical protein
MPCGYSELQSASVEYKNLCMDQDGNAASLHLYGAASLVRVYIEAACAKVQQTHF